MIGCVCCADDQFLCFLFFFSFLFKHFDFTKLNLIIKSYSMLAYYLLSQGFCFSNNKIKNIDDRWLMIHRIFNRTNLYFIVDC